MGKRKITAVIEIGSNMLILKIAQRKAKKLEILDCAEYPLSLGRDTFSKGKIGFDKVEKTCEVINGFINIAKSYGVENIKTVATTAVREAKNRYYILDQIRVKTGLDVRVSDDAEEKIYNYRNILREINANNVKGTSLIAYISSGSLGVALYKNEKIIYNQNILIGSLKLSEILGDIKYNTDKLYIMIDDYLSSFTHMLKKMLPVKDIKNFIVAGRGIKLLARECEAKIKSESYIIAKTDFDNFYNEVKDKMPEKLVEIYGISEEKSEILLTSLGIYKALWELTISDHIISPINEFSDSILYQELFEQESKEVEEKIYKSAIATARKLGEKYLYDNAHSEFVEKMALKIFDRLKKVHGLGNKERLILQVSAILHDIGKFVNIKSHYKHSYSLIKGSDIVGMSQKDIEIVANIARYHSRQLPMNDSKEYKKLDITERVLASKLLAILRIADALDRSHNQKIHDYKISLKNNELLIDVKIEENILIDEWTFIKKAKFMMEVFGIKAVIKKRRI